jgi:hypothetical protein
MSYTVRIEDEAEKLSAELATLYKQQYEALQKASYLKMSPKQAAAYDRRRLRIGRICELLAKFKPLV